MTTVFLIPISVFMGLAGLFGFLWSLRNDQFSDLDGAPWRVILEQRDGPIPEQDGGDRNRSDRNG